jgi:hypothetical protein
VSTVLNDPAPELLAGAQGVYSGGAWQDGQGESLKMVDPSTERVIGRIGTATPRCARRGRLSRAGLG